MKFKLLSVSSYGNRHIIYGDYAKLWTFLSEKLQKEIIWNFDTRYTSQDLLIFRIKYHVVFLTKPLNWLPLI